MKQSIRSIYWSFQSNASLSQLLTFTARQLPSFSLFPLAVRAISIVYHTYRIHQTNSGTISFHQIHMNTPHTPIATRAKQTFRLLI